MPFTEAAFDQPLPESEHEPIIHTIESKHKDMPVLAKEEFMIFGEQVDEIYEAYVEVVEWLKMPYLEDGFTDHLERSAWLDKLEPAQRKLMMDNKFRNNPVAITILHLNNLKDALARAKPKIRIAFPDLTKEKAALPKTTDDYDARMKIMESIADKLRAVTDSLHTKIKQGLRKAA